MAPVYNTKKHLIKILKSKLILNNKYNIKNSIELTKQKIELTQNSKLISLDIKDMYTNIPVAETIDIIKLQLQDLQENPNFI